MQEARLKSKRKMDKKNIKDKRNVINENKSKMGTGEASSPFSRTKKVQKVGESGEMKKSEEVKKDDAGAMTARVKGVIRTGKWSGGIKDDN